MVIKGGVFAFSFPSTRGIHTRWVECAPVCTSRCLRGQPSDCICADGASRVVRTCWRTDWSRVAVVPFELSKRKKTASCSGTLILFKKPQLTRYPLLVSPLTRFHSSRLSSSARWARVLRRARASSRRTRSRPCRMSINPLNLLALWKVLGSPSTLEVLGFRGVGDPVLRAQL